MTLEDSIEKIIIGIPSGEVFFVEDQNKLNDLKNKKLIWIKVTGRNSFSFVFKDKDIKKISEILL